MLYTAAESCLAAVKGALKYDVLLGSECQADADVEVRELGERRPIWQQLAQAWQADSSAALAATLMVAAAAAGSPDIRQAEYLRPERA